MPDHIMHIADVAEVLSTPAGTLRYWRHCGTGPTSFKIGRRVAYRRSDVLEWLAHRENETMRGDVVPQQ